MDINSLLSPQDSPAADTPPSALPSPALQQQQSPGKRPSLRQIPSRTPSGPSHQLGRSPQYHHDQLPTPNPTQTQTQTQASFHQHQHQHQHQRQHLSPALLSPSITNFSNGRPSSVHSATNTPPLGSPFDARITPPHPLARQASTPGMDTLADLASMQHQQQAARQNNQAQQRPSITLQNVPRTISAGSATELTMGEARPRSFDTKSLSKENIEALAQLDKALAENPFDYYSLFTFITILHQGLQTHVYTATLTPQSTTTTPDGTYELLPILREAYDAMDRKYALGEVLWAYRLTDEKSLARTIEDRLAILEYYKKATQEEPYSAKLWVSYGEYIAHLLACVWDPKPPEQWSNDDRALGKSLFTMELLMNTWISGAEAVKHNLDDSNLVWDRYIQTLQEDLERHPNPEKVGSVFKVIQDRLKQPHATWDQTFQVFSTFTSRYYDRDYDAIIADAIKRYNKKFYAIREQFEFEILKATQQGDKGSEHQAFIRYLRWEKKKEGVFSFPWINALYERATLRFPVDPSLWEDHVEFLIGSDDRTVSRLNVLERATRHCPWSGALWSHRLLTLEASEETFEEIESVKHRATRTGLLEHTGIEELVKVQIAWCGYLRRRAFDKPGATEDDLDIAEVGIRSGQELVHETGLKKYGRDWKGDPKHRLERIYIKFWTQRGNLDEARKIWEQLVERGQDSFDFWYRYYIWEMIVWSNQAIGGKNNPSQHLGAPSKATAVLEQGMKHLWTIDQPEPLVDMYMNHCEQHETVLKVRSAMIECRHSERLVARRRQKEELTEPVIGKRKRDDIEETESAKKTRQDAVDDDVPGPSTETEAQGEDEAAPERNGRESSVFSAGRGVPQRDREHTTIIVRQLPIDVTQTRLRQFFSDSGTVKDVTLKQEQDSMTATVEFEAPEEAEYAMLKEVKGFEGHDITIKRGESTTVYVTNYPVHADEAYMRKLFTPFGDIMEVRFPSLKYNAHRRFCYVQFTSAEAASAAVAQLDNTDLEGNKVLVKLSNPMVKKKREGATEEGREVYVWHINYKTTRNEVKDAFRAFGHIVDIRMPTRPPNNHNKGFCYIVFRSKAMADAAVAEMDGKQLWGLDIRVSIAQDQEASNRKHRAVVEHREEDREGTPGSDKAPGSQQPLRVRTVVLLDVADTVSAHRLEKLAESYGLKKVTLEPDHSGARLEFTSAEGAGKAQLALDGMELDGRKVRVGTVPELRKAKEEWKPSTTFIQPRNINRSAPRGGGLGLRGRGRGRPGLGFGVTRSEGLKTAGAGSTDANGKKEAKNNADFRAMLLGKKEGDAKDGDAKMGNDGDALV